jgi:hypothetical protein
MAVALRSTLLAMGPDAGAMLVTKTGARPLAGVRSSKNSPIVVSGDRAIVAGDDASFVVRLDGTEPSKTRVPFSIEKSKHKVFPTAAGGFLLFETTYDAPNYADMIARAFLFDDAGAASDIAFGPYSNPSLAWADATRAWIVADRADRAADLIAIDLLGKQVSKTLPFPLCDRVAMRKQERCLP